MKQATQNSEVYDEIISGKSLLQMYLEMKDERDQLATTLARKAMGIPYAGGQTYEPEFGKLGPNEFPDDELETLSEFDLEDEIMNENSIENIEVTDNPDGSANITMDIDEFAQKALMKQGLQYLIDEMKMHDEIIVLEPNEFTGEAKNWELSDDDRNALFHFGFINALRMGMAK